MGKNTSYQELSYLIITAIEEEQFFNKEVLLPKVKAILNGFSMNLNETKYNEIRNPTEIARILRSKELACQEKIYWRNIVKSIDPDNIKKYYEGADKFKETLLTTPNEPKTN